MPYIQVNDRQYPLSAGETTIGGGERIPLAGAPPGPQAVITLGADQHAVIRRASPECGVRVNDVQLGAEPTPLLHGDKIDVLGVELLYGDDRKGGSTQYLAPILPQEVRTADAGRRATSAATGGRLVSLVDGREFAVAPSGLTIGRDASCDVVLPGGDVSRRHAEVTVGETGYIITDMSTNGVVVNGQPIRGSQTLARGDVIRVGREEFRFYADVAPKPAAAPSAALPAPVATPAPPAPAAAVSAAPVLAAPLPVPVTPPVPVTAPSAPGAAVAGDARPVLATLEVVGEGVLKGRTYDLRLPLTHIGRGAHNDIVLGDESVSDAHAKIQRRDAGWFVVDMGSTNGTYVGGRRIEGELVLHGRTDLRFGGVKVAFRPLVDATRPVVAPSAEAKGTRVIAGVTRDSVRRTPAPVASPRPSAPPDPKSGSSAIRLVLLALLAAAAAAAFFIEGR